MNYLPIFIDIKQQPCLVVGGGDIALRKINLLLKANAAITCVSKECCDGIENTTIHAPTLIIIGEEVKLREKLNWFDADND